MGSVFVGSSELQAANITTEAKTKIFFIIVDLIYLIIKLPGGSKR
jgi:hypothetical protein